MFETYFQAERSYFRDMGRAFAEKHPALAGMLAERGTDPDVERLLEGFAFMTARLRQRIDDAAPELVETLAELLMPHLVRPTPASTIVEFRPAAKSLRGRLRVERGARLLSKAVRGTRCTFTTARALDILPLRLLGFRLDDTAQSRPELTLRFELEPGGEPSVFTREGVRLHLHGESPTVSQLYLWLSSYVASVAVRSAQGSVELAPRSVRPIGFDRGDALFPWPAFSPHSVRALLEYFTLPAKFLFVDLTDLDRAAHLATSSFELCLRFHKPPALPTRLPDDALRLHCTPAVNLFEVGAEPVRAGFDERPTLLRAGGIDPAHMEVFSVRSVTGLHRRERAIYEPFHSFRHALPGARHAGFYKLTRQPSPVDDGMHTSLSLQRGAALPDGSEEALSIELTCTNRSLTQELQADDINTPSADIPSGVAFSNIARVSAPARPPLGSDLLWHFLSHLACSRRSLADAPVLKTLLSLYAASDRTDHAASRVHRARIEAIASVRAETVTRVVRGVAAHGSRYDIELDQSGFASEGDAFLFGSVLHQLLAVDARLNTFADLRLSLSPSGSQFRYDAELAP